MHSQKIVGLEPDNAEIDEIFLRRKKPTMWELLKNWLKKFLP